MTDVLEVIERQQRAKHRALIGYVDVNYFNISLKTMIDERKQWYPMLEMCRGCRREWYCPQYKAVGLTYVRCGYRNKEWRV